MPDFAPTVTPRLRVTYQAAGLVHTMTLRTVRGATLAATVSAREGVFHDLFNALAPLLADDFVFITEDWAATDSDIFVPTGSLPAAVTGTQDVADFSANQKVTGTTFSGKGSSGSKVRVTAYGVLWATDGPGNDAGNGVVTSGESSEVAAGVAALSTHTGAIDGTTATFYPRATTKVNDKLLKLARRGLIS